ncbi:hypothetical protein Lsed01_00647 [Demequina sediminis]|uniref:Uncharacterized protein n=1 Tax=Demequina sediminis TaxID=1930058 RepID=A0ABP9WEJ7_9MICO
MSSTERELERPGRRVVELLAGRGDNIAAERYRSR